MSKQLLIQQIPDQICFEYELKDSRQNSNRSQWAKPMNNFPYHYVESIRVYKISVHLIITFKMTEKQKYHKGFKSINKFIPIKTINKKFHGDNKSRFYANKPKYWNNNTNLSCFEIMDIFDPKELALLQEDPDENASLETLLTKHNLPLLEFLSIKNIQPKIRSNFNYFIKYCQKNEDFCFNLIDIGIKCPMH